MADDILIATTSAMFRDGNGDVVRIRRGKTTVRKGHPLLRGREEMFAPLEVTFDVPKVQAKKK